MLCYHVLAQSQCYVGRHASSEHIACHRYVDQTIHLTPGPAIAAVKNVKTNHTATIGAKRQHCRTAEPTVPLHANLREQGPGHGLFESPSARPSLDDYITSRGAKLGAGEPTKVPPRTGRRPSAGGLRKARKRERRANRLREQQLLGWVSVVGDLAV